MIDIPNFELILNDPRLNIDIIGLTLSYATDVEKAQISAYFQEHAGQLQISPDEVSRIEAGMFEVRTGPELEHTRALNDFLTNPDAVWNPDVENWWEQGQAGGGDGPLGAGDGLPGGGEGPPGGVEDPPGGEGPAEGE